MSSDSLVVGKACQSVQIDGKVTKLDGFRPLLCSGSPPGQGTSKRKSWENPKISDFFDFFSNFTNRSPGCVGPLRASVWAPKRPLVPLRDLQLPVETSAVCSHHRGCAEGVADPRKYEKEEDSEEEVKLEEDS